jgi:hypothetical protein
MDMESFARPVLLTQGKYGWPDAMVVTFGANNVVQADDGGDGLIGWCAECQVDVRGGGHPQCAG